MTLSDAPRVAELHAALLSYSFFAKIGQAFLRRLYRRLVESRHGLGFVHEVDGEVDAFISAAYDSGALRREFLCKDGLAAALLVALAAVRRPWVAYHSIGTLLYGSKTELPGVRAEMLFIGIEPTVRRQGLARDIIGRVLDAYEQRGIERVKVTTDAVNRGVNALLAGLGFEPQFQFRLHGKEMVLHSRSLWPR